MVYLKDPASVSLFNLFYEALNIAVIPSRIKEIKGILDKSEFPVYRLPGFSGYEVYLRSPASEAELK